MGLIFQISLLVAGSLTCLAIEKISRQVLNFEFTASQKQKIVSSPFRNKIFLLGSELDGSLVRSVLKNGSTTTYSAIIFLLISIFLPNIPILFSLFVLASAVCYRIAVTKYLKY